MFLTSCSIALVRCVFLNDTGKREAPSIRLPHVLQSQTDCQLTKSPGRTGFRHSPVPESNLLSGMMPVMVQEMRKICSSKTFDQSQWEKRLYKLSNVKVQLNSFYTSFFVTQNLAWPSHKVAFYLSLLFTLCACPITFIMITLRRNLNQGGCVLSSAPPCGAKNTDRLHFPSA